MKKIHKYILEAVDVQQLVVPTGSKLLSVKEQFGEIALYALIDDAQGGLDSFEIFIKKTGPLSDNIDNCEFLGTVKLDDGRLMFHVFYSRGKNDSAGI